MARQKKMTQAEAKKRIRAAGMRGKYDPEWGWRIAFPDNDEASAYYTDDIEDAVSTAEEMARSRAANPHPQAYDPQEGYMYQILCRNPSYGRAWEHCDYATNRADKKHLLENYREAYGPGWEFKTIMLPEKYWPKDWRVAYEAERQARAKTSGESVGNPSDNPSTKKLKAKLLR